MTMFEYTETTVDHTGVVRNSFHSEPEFGTAEDFLERVYKKHEGKPRTLVVQSGDAIMVVTSSDSTLVQAEDLTED